MTAPLCVVTGATGAIGPLIVDELARSGFRVRGVSRHGADAADVTDLDAMRRVLDGADCAVHAAALLHINNPSPELHEQYRRVNVGGTENVARAAEEAGVRRIVYCSTIAVYGYNRGRTLTEDDEPRPDTIYGETKLAGERAVLVSGRGTVLRLSAVYGARVKGNYQRLLRNIARGRFARIGDGSNRRTLVHERDVARAAVLAATHPDAVNGVFNVSDGTTHTVREIIDAMAAAVGRKPPRLTLPVAPIRLAIGATESLARLAHIRPPVTRALLDKYLEDVAVSGDRIRQTLGFEPVYDLRAGWAAAALGVPPPRRP
ncbi:MAG TPA: NAD-dependent epimerase/dehydratase family protein [Thermoanaerobaculia bacterium]|nr:NAD-dependent epimerase/dehydratase family protein [Thermoanaerobaculia bacterium]